MMLVVRQAQIDAFRRQRIAAFLDRAQAFISERLRRPVAPQEIDALYERGKLYGLLSEQDFVRYMFVAVAVGASTAGSDPEWMRAVLAVATPSNELKLHRLFDEAQKRLQPAALGLV